MTSRVDPQTTKKIQSILDDFLVYWNNKDLNAFMSLFHEDAEFTDVVGQTAIGLDAIRKQHEFAFTVVMKDASFEMSKYHIREITDGVILVSARWLNQNSRSIHGKILPDRNGVLQLVMIQDDEGNWKIKLVHNSDFALPYQKQEKIII